MELNQLEYYRVLCKYGNYTRASKELNISQPAISAAIKKLAAECNDMLVLRSNGEFTITPKGEVLLNWATRIHNDIEKMQEELDAFALKQREIIRLALPFPLCPELLEQTVPRFGAEHTEAALHLLQEGHTQIVSGLKNKSIDLGIICADMLDDELDWKPYKKIEYYAYFSPAHRFSGAKKLTPEMFEGEKIIIPRIANSISKAARDYFSQSDISPEFTFVDAFPADVWQLAARGNGVAFVPVHTCPEGGLALSPPLYSELVVVWKKTRSLTRTRAELIDFILKEA